jgi:hypothetical protein
MGLVSPFGGRILGNTFVYILQLGVQRGISIGGCSMLKNNCQWANECGSLKIERKVMSTHMNYLI